jgi:adenylosuccinate synthase
MVRKAINDSLLVLAESAQGFDLSINQGRMYPYVTSRAVDVAQTMSDCGVPPRYCGDVYGCVRCHPIRVGNVVREGKLVGFSGPPYEDQEELDWKWITEHSGSLNPILELTTVTGKVRRVFTWSDLQMQKFVDVCAPDFLCLNFVNYLDIGIENASDAELISDHPKVMEMITHVEKFGIQIAYLGTGAGEEAMIDMRTDLYS